MNYLLIHLYFELGFKQPYHFPQIYSYSIDEIITFESIDYAQRESLRRELSRCRPLKDRPLDDC